jgi:deaminated glutathione amidase
LFLPEASDYIASSGQASLSLAVPQDSSPFVTGLRDAAKKYGVAVHVGIHHVTEGGIGSGPGSGSGSGPGPVPGGRTGDAADGSTTTASTTQRLLNRALYITADGDINEAAAYDKLHVFDYGTLRESATVQPGNALTPPFDTPIGRLGSLICFDLRFPEASLALAQPGSSSAWASRPAQLLAFPSAFTIRTGEAHWETLLRSRAIESQAWVFAAAQVGRHNEKRASYGCSLVVDPWGRVAVRLPGVLDEEGNVRDDAVEAIGFVDVDLGEVERVRMEMPLQRRRSVVPLNRILHIPDFS